MAHDAMPRGKLCIHVEIAVTINYIVFQANVNDLGAALFIIGIIAIGRLHITRKKGDARSMLHGFGVSSTLQCSFQFLGRRWATPGTSAHGFMA